MGLRKLLGLPRSRDSRSTPVAENPPDRSKFNAVLDKYEKLVSHPDYGMLDPDDEAALHRQFGLAMNEADAGDPEEAAKTLMGAVALSAQALSRAKMNMVRVGELSGAVSGALDGARLTGVTVAELVGHRSELDTVPGDVGLNSSQKASRMEALQRAVDTDPTIIAAKAAQGRYLSKHSSVKAAGARALEVSSLPPIVNRSNPQLDDALGKMSFAAGRIDFRTAVSEMDRAAVHTDRIEAERDRIEQALAAKKAADDFHVLIEADVKRARTIVGIGAEEEAIVTLFGELDAEFYGAMQAGRYGVALQIGKKLEKSVARVFPLEDRNKERLAAAGRAGVVYQEGLKLYKSLSLPSPLPIAIDLVDDAVILAAGNYDTAQERDDYEAAFAAATAFLAEARKLKGMIDDAPAIELKYNEADALWTSVKPRYETIDAKTYVSATLEALQSEIRKAEIRRDGISRGDVDEYLAAVRGVEAFADRIDASASEEAAAVQRKAEFNIAFTKAASDGEALEKFVANGPTLQGSIDQVVALLATVRSLFEKGHATTEAKLTELTELIQRTEAIKAGDGEEADETKVLSDKRWDAGRSDVLESLTLARDIPNVKEMKDLRGQRQSLLSAALAARKNVQWALSLTIMDKLEPVIADIIRRHAEIKQRDVENKAEFDRRKAALAADLTAIEAYDGSLGAAFKQARDAVVRGKTGIEFPESTADWVWALDSLPALESAVSEGIKLRVGHADAKRDHDYVVALKTRVGADVDTLCVQKPRSVDSEDIIRRAINGKAIGNKAFGDKDFALSKTYWDRAEAAISDWNGGGKDEADTENAAMALVVARHGNINDLTEARKVIASTPEAKEPVARLSSAYARFYAAYKAYDHVVANAALDDVESCVQPVMAIKVAADAAQMQHVAARDAAATTLSAKTAQQLHDMSRAERRDLLVALHSAGATNLNDEQKVQRAKLYDAMTVDPEFDRVDNERRTELVDSLKADEDVKEARGKWGQMDLDARLALLQKVMQKESTIYDIPVPTMRTFNVKPGDEGFFDPTSYTMNVNMHPMSGFSDFKEAVDTVVHETAHAYQKILAERIEDGLVGEDAPEYDEGKVFAQNAAGYVSPEDAKAAGNDTYNTQPIERHAWDTGGGVATELLSLPIDVEPGATL